MLHEDLASVFIKIIFLEEYIEEFYADRRCSSINWTSLESAGLKSIVNDRCT